MAADETLAQMRVRILKELGGDKITIVGEAGEPKTVAVYAQFRPQRVFLNVAATSDREVLEIVLAEMGETT